MEPIEDDDNECLMCGRPISFYRDYCTYCTDDLYDDITDDDIDDIYSD